MTNRAFNELTNDASTMKKKIKKTVFTVKVYLENDINSFHTTLTSACAECNLLRGQIIIAFAKA